jgi:uncharacterized membrane protein
MLAKHLDGFSVALYGASNVVSGFSFLVLRLTVIRRLRRAGTLNAQDTAARPKDTVSIVAYLVAIPLAFFHAYTALGLIAAVTLIWVVPTIGVEPCEEDDVRSSGVVL